LASDARRLIELVALGRQIGLQEGNCPLCAKGQSHDEFEHGLAIAEGIARRLDEVAAQEAEREKARVAAESRLVEAKRNVDAATSAQTNALGRIEAFDRAREACGIDHDATPDPVRNRVAELRQSLERAQNDLRILDTLRLNSELERAQRAEADLKSRLLRNQERLGRAHKAEALAQALYDAARRATGETLDVRLERVLPLISELYRRLRPHPIWRDIEYSIRGDVRRFLRLQVGEELNPQFLFSSGQRRATGLAFLLSINISLAWSRWRSILLDDPVQHVDDFRTIHLAEVTACR
jgi:chromosome segregation protein